jgi:hypothetical protein
MTNRKSCEVLRAKSGTITNQLKVVRNKYVEFAGVEKRTISI